MQLSELLDLGTHAQQVGETIPCPARVQCLAGALERQEPWGVWGGQLLVQGAVVARKRPRGRPRKHPVAA